MNNSPSNNIGRVPSGGILTEIFSDELCSDISGDYIIPDYVSDADRILLCSACAKIEDKYSDSEAAVISGAVTFCVLLCTEGNSLSSLTFSEPFEITAPVGGIEPESLISVNLKQAPAYCRLINPRKLGIKTTVCADTSIYSVKDISPEISGTDSPTDAMTTARLLKTQKTAKIHSLEEHDIHASYDIELDSGYPCAEEIILCKIEPKPCDTRVRGNDADIRTDMQVTCIYLTEDGEYFSADKKITLEKNIPNVIGDIEWIATASAFEVEAKIAPNAYGERKIIELDFDYDINMTAITSDDAVSVCDMYSTEYECSCSFDSIPVTVFKRLYQTNITVNASSERNACGGEEVKTVFAGNAVIKDSYTEYQKEKNRITVFGNAVLQLLCQGGLADDASYYSISFEYPFKCELDASYDMENGDFKTELFISDAKFRCDSQKLYADFELTARVTALGKENLRYLKNAELQKDVPASNSPAPMTLCYPSSEDTLWDISKYYHITEESILLANALESRDISEKKVLLIPRA